MLETAAVIATDGDVLCWHLPADRQFAAIPDSRGLWEVMWDNRDRLVGVAHTHPGAGTPFPSWTDLTTFAACEDGLGRRLRWWIATRDQIRCFLHTGPARLSYVGWPVLETPRWLRTLREYSDYPPETFSTKRSVR